MTIKERLARLEAQIETIMKNDLPHIKRLLYGILLAVILGFIGLMVKSFFGG